MSDPQSAALLVFLGVVGFITWYRGRNTGQREKLFGGTSTPTGKTGAHLPPGEQLGPLAIFANAWGLRITPNPTGGTHVKGSLHYLGRAIDVSSRGLTEDLIDKIKAAATAQGLRVRDERKRPPGEWQWTGPHLHIEAPE